MVQIEKLAERIFSLLKGNGFKIKIFDEDGNETTDPTQGRRFFVAEPNFMITIDEDSNEVEFSKGASVDFEKSSDLQDRLKKITDSFLVNTTIKVFGKSIQPRDFSYKAKMMKENMVTPVNSHLLGQVFNKLKTFGKASAYTLSDEVGAELNDVQRVLNKLVKDGKIAVKGAEYGDPVYTLKMEEVVTEKRTDSMKKTNPIAESSLSRMTGSSRTSQQTLENIKLIIRHKKPVNEEVRGSRSRGISAIFLESNGERFRFPINHLAGARAMAQHMAHGGNMYDKVGGYITENTEWLVKLQNFNRYVTTNKLINEDSSGIVETIKENIETIKTELKKLTGSKTYETVSARISSFEREPLSEDDTSQLKDLFTIRRFDEKFEEVLPIVKQLIQEKDTYLKRIEEAANNVVRLRRDAINTIPMFEFASKNAQFGFKLNELALRITENDELAGFINKIGNKLCKESEVNDFERAIINRVLENSVVTGVKEDSDSSSKKYEVYDRQTGKIVGGPYSDRKKARSRADKLDNEYGAYRYGVRAIEEIKESESLSTFFDKYDYNFM